MFVLQLAPDDAWKCPHCKQMQQGMVKMSLWTLPDILILHLKRFRQVGKRRNKLSTLIRFPVSALDMTPHVVKRSQSMKNLAPLPSTWKHGDTDFLYDLYAVCNHHGGMHGGHYTGEFAGISDSIEAGGLKTFSLLLLLHKGFFMFLQLSVILALRISLSYINL